MLGRRLSVLVGVLAASAVWVPHAVASTLTVNTTADDTSPYDGVCSLRDAINAVDSPGSQHGACAAAAFGPNTIVLAPDRYTLSFPNGELSIPSTVRDLTISGAGEKRTTIDATGLVDRALEVAAGATVTITNLTITGGLAPGGQGGANATSGAASPGGPGGNGGGILNEGTLTVLDAAVTDSQAGGGGAGGNGFSATSSTDPAVIGGQGGAGGQGGGIFNSGALALTGATLTGNSGGAGGSGGPGGQGVAGPSAVGGAGGAGGAGGGLATDDGSVTITGSTINGNTAGAGGSGALGGQGSAFPGGAGGAGGSGGTGADGGGLWSSGGGLSLTNSTIASNTAGAGGAGGAGGFGNNHAGGNGGNGANGGNGGGLAATAATLVNVTLAGNQGAASGAGGNAGSGTPNGSTGSASSGGATGGVYGEGQTAITLQNTLLDLNAGNCGGSIADGGHNLSSGDSTCPASFLSGDPDLGALQDNGGPSETIGLQSGSAALGQGAGCPATDQRGVPRPSPACDIGAYQVAAPIAVTGPAVSVTNGGAVIRATVTPNSGDATVWFQYGKTKINGSVTAVQHLDGVTAMTVEARLTRLRSKKVYYYRVVATSTDGGAIGAQKRFRTGGRPVISGLTLNPRSLKRTGTIAYQDSSYATTTFAVLRCVSPAGRRCMSYRRVRSFKHKDVAGRNRVRLNARGLAPGAYTLQATPRAGRLKGRTAAVTFAVRE